MKILLKLCYDSKMYEALYRCPAIRHAKKSHTQTHPHILTHTYTHTHTHTHLCSGKLVAEKCVFLTLNDVYPGLLEVGVS